MGRDQKRERPSTVSLSRGRKGCVNIALMTMEDQRTRCINFPLFCFIDLGKMAEDTFKQGGGRPPSERKTCLKLRFSNGPTRMRATGDDTGSRFLHTIFASWNVLARLRVWSRKHYARTSPIRCSRYVVAVDLEPVMIEWTIAIIRERHGKNER